MTESEIRQIAIAALRCDGQLREALQTYESIQDLVERNKPVLDALTLAAGPLSVALDAMRRVESSAPRVAQMAATKVLEDALAGANRVQAMLDAIPPLRAALDAIEKVRLSARDGRS